jgi:hypothetical protein
MISALGMVLMVQTPHTVKLVAQMSQYGYWGAMYEGVVASIFVELAVVYFALNGRKWQTAIAMLGMAVINYGYYQESILELDPVAIMLMLTIPVLVWQITEVAGQSEPEVVQPGPKAVQPEPEVVQEPGHDGTDKFRLDKSLSQEDQIRQLLSQGFTQRLTAAMLGVSKSKVNRVNKKNGFAILEYEDGFK